MKSICITVKLEHLVLGDLYVYVEKQGSRLMYLWFMAWGKVSASILLLIGWPTEARKVPWSGKWYPEDNSTHSYWVASLFPLLVPPSQTFSVSVLEFPSLHPEVKQVTSAFLGCSHYFGWWEERVLSQLFSSCCISWTVFLFSQQSSVKTASDSGPCASPLSHSLL